MNIDKQVGVLIGNFEPLHLGHIRSILNVVGQVKNLHIFITSHPQPNPKYSVTLEDKARWIQKAFQDFPFIYVHILESIELPINAPQNFDKVNVDVLVSSSKLVYAIEQAGLNISASKNSPTSPILFVSENHPLYKPDVRAHLPFKVQSVPTYAEFDSYAIHQNPVKYWHSIHPEARSNYTKTIVIVGGENVGKTTLVHKLAHYYGADVAIDKGGYSVLNDLGDTEVDLQYSDYATIALNHAHAIREATYLAKAPVTIIDSDFVSIQAYCEEYTGRTHPFATACIEEFHLDYTIMLEDNAPWMAHGMMSMSEDNSISRFDNQLMKIFSRHHMTPHRINRDDYHQRFFALVEYIDKEVYGLSEKLSS